MFNVPMGEGLASPVDAAVTEKKGPAFSDLERCGKYDLFGMKIKSYHYVPSDNVLSSLENQEQSSELDADDENADLKHFADVRQLKIMPIEGMISVDVGTVAAEEEELDVESKSVMSQI